MYTLCVAVCSFPFIFLSAFLLFGGLLLSSLLYSVTGFWPYGAAGLSRSSHPAPIQNILGKRVSCKQVAEWVPSTNLLHEAHAFQINARAFQVVPTGQFSLARPLGATVQIYYIYVALLESEWYPPVNIDSYFVESEWYPPVKSRKLDEEEIASKYR